MYSAYHNKWLRHKFNGNQFVRVDVNNITDATPMIILLRESDGDYDESVYMYPTVHIKKLYVENYNEWWSDRCGNGCLSWNAIECQPEHLVDKGNWAKSYERFKIRPNTDGDDVCYTPDFIDDSRLGNSRQKCEFTWNIKGNSYDHYCGYKKAWGAEAMFCKKQIDKDESQLVFYTLEVVSDVVYEDGSYAVTYIDQERDCSTTNENSFIDTNKCYSISNGDKYCNYVYEFENSDSNNDNTNDTNDISDNSGYLLCSDDTITSVFSFVSTDDDNVFLLKPKSVYDTNEKYCYVDTVSDENNIKCVASSSDDDNTNNMNDNNDNNDNNVNSNIVTFNMDDLKSKNIYNFNLINLNDSTTTTASVNSNTTTSTTSNNSNNDDDPNCYKNTYLVNKKGNTYCYSNPLDKKIYCDLNEENNNTSDKFFTNFKIEIQNCNTYDGRLDVNSIINHISLKNKYFKIKSVKTDKWLQNNISDKRIGFLGSKW